MHKVNKLSFSLLLKFSEQHLMWQKNSKPFTDCEVRLIFRKVIPYTWDESYTVKLLPLI